MIEFKQSKSTQGKVQVIKDGKPDGYILTMGDFIEKEPESKAKRERRKKAQEYRW